MAFGDLKGTLAGSGPSVTNPSNLTGSVSVAVGDLVLAFFSQQTNLTASGATDNLGNSYSAQNAGTDAGTVTGRLFYSRATVAGTLTTIHVAATASNNDYAGIAGVLEGPVASPPIDKNPANITADLTSPFNCPATGTLSQANEIVIAWIAAFGAVAGGTWAATSPNLLAASANLDANCLAALGYQAVSSTSSVTPVFTYSTNPTADALGTCSFKKAPPFVPGWVNQATRIVEGAF